MKEKFVRVYVFWERKFLFINTIESSGLLWNFFEGDRKNSCVMCICVTIIV